MTHLIGEMCRSFPVAGRTAVIVIDTQRRDDGSLRFLTQWQPGPPERMTSEDMALFDRFKRQAIADLTAAWEAMP